MMATIPGPRWFIGAVSVVMLAACSAGGAGGAPSPAGDNSQATAASTAVPTETPPESSPAATSTEPSASSPATASPGSTSSATGTAPVDPGGGLAPAPTPDQVLAAVKASGVKLKVEDGWNAEWDLPSRQADWHPVGVMLHHTGTAVAGNAPSEQFLLDFDQPLQLTRYDGLQGGTRGANFLVGRDGTVYFMRATRGPHAGTGDELRLGNDVIEADNGNGRLYGIEIESAGTSGEIHPNADFIDGFGEQQVTATAKLTAALLTLIHRDVTHVIDHKEYAGSRKDDLVGNMVETFRQRTVAYLPR